MIATLTSTSSEMAAPSIFSYAQAAKGQGAPPSNTSSNPTSQASPQDPTAGKSATLVENTADTTETARAPDARSAPVSEKQDTDSVPRSESDVQSESNQGKRSESRRDDEVNRLDRPWRRTDKSTRSSSAATRSVDEHDSRKPRKGKKAKAADKQSSDQASAADKDQEAEPEPPKIELSEAPIPTVNPWHQRSVKSAPTPAANTVEATNGTPAPVQESQKAAKPVEASATTTPVAATNGVKPPRKSGDVARPERAGSRGSRVADKEGKDGKTEVPPPVGDSASWPTPETAIKDAKKPADKAMSSEKEAHDEALQGKHKKANWVAYDYVPTVSFETQLPQLRGSKPRGGARGANGTRTAASGQAGDKTTSLAAPVNKPTETKERLREAVNGANGTAPAQAAGKRASVDVGSTREPRKPAAHANAEQGKENHSTEQGKPTRDRPEGRGERGARGGYRGRGHHALNTHGQHQHAASTVGPQGYPTGQMPIRPQGPYSPPPRQNSHGQMYMPPPQQRGRGGRNGAGGNYHRISLPNGRIPPVQTQFGPYEYPLPPMSAMPYQSPTYWENAAVLPVLRTQIEYYFSIENLCKDMYLRSHMDSQGFVPLHFVAAFKRVRNLSGDMGLVRAACEESAELDYVVGEDDVERLRRRDNFERWVLSYPEREELARTDGPVHLAFKGNRFPFSHQFNGMGASPYAMVSPPAYPGYAEAPFPQYMEEQQHDYRLNEGINGFGNGIGHGSTQLSAEVPDFSPSGNFTVGGLGATSEKSPNVHVSAALDALNGHAEGHAVEGMTNGVHVDAQDSAQS